MPRDEKEAEFKSAKYVWSTSGFFSGWGCLINSVLIVLGIFGIVAAVTNLTAGPDPKLTDYVSMNQDVFDRRERWDNIFTLAMSSIILFGGPFILYRLRSFAEIRVTGTKLLVKAAPGTGGDIVEIDYNDVEGVHTGTHLDETVAAGHTPRLNRRTAMVLRSQGYIDLAYRDSSKNLKTIRLKDWIPTEGVFPNHHWHAAFLELELSIDLLNSGDSEACKKAIECLFRLAKWHLRESPSLVSGSTLKKITSALKNADPTCATELRKLLQQLIPICRKHTDDKFAAKEIDEATRVIGQTGNS